MCPYLTGIIAGWQPAKRSCNPNKHVSNPLYTGHFRKWHKFHGWIDPAAVPGYISGRPDGARWLDIVGTARSGGLARPGIKAMWPCRAVYGGRVGPGDRAQPYQSL
jgi:hypothetical protein